MSPTAVAHHRSVPEEDYGLEAVASHNATTTMEEFPPYQDDAKGLGIYHEGYTPVYHTEQMYVHSPPTPRSNTASEGIRTRSGRSTRRTDSPFSNSNRVSNSPAARSKKEKKSKLDKSKTPKLTAPLSVLTKDMSVPLRDIEAWVNRPGEERKKEVEKRNGYVTRPMNSFMLYRSAYAERTKQWCLQNNHQVVSSVSGESWPMEPDEVRNKFDEWAKIERANHQAAHPDYKFSPSKSINKRRKGGYSDDEDEPSDLDGDPDGEYRGGRSVRRRREDHGAVNYMNEIHGFESHPYYGQSTTDYEQTQCQYANNTRTVPSNVAYDHHGLSCNVHANNYLPAGMHLLSQYPYIQDVHGVRVPTPGSLNSAQSLGGYGLPGGHVSTEDLFTPSRTGTPMQQQHSSSSPQYGQYGRSLYSQYQPQYQPQGYHSSTPTPVSAAQLYEHQQYLHQASQPQAAIDPSLEAELAAAAASGGQLPVGGHFEDALGEMGSADMTAFHDYYQPSTSQVNGGMTLEPTWSPSDDLK